VAENPLRGHPTTRASEEAELLIPALTPSAGACPVGPLERQLLGQIDGERTVAEIAPRVGLAPAEACALISRLAQLGAVTVTVMESSASIEVEVEEEDEPHAPEELEKDVDKGWG
jgi:hypothetical protein